MSPTPYYATFRRVLATYQGGVAELMSTYYNDPFQITKPFTLPILRVFPGYISQLPATQRSKALILFWRFHRWLFRVSDGRLGASLFGRQVLKLTMTGRRSGKPRSIMIYYFSHGDSPVIVASNVGADQHPAWYLNLQANPAAEIQIGRERWPVVARTAAGEERQHLWAEIVAKDSDFLDYQRRTDREFPLVILDRVDKDPSKEA
jgi:deazaflavin-dependent oxidoreductase (nitroreductase family)